MVLSGAAWSPGEAPRAPLTATLLQRMTQDSLHPTSGQTETRGRIPFVWHPFLCYEAPTLLAGPAPAVSEQGALVSWPQGGDVGEMFRSSTQMNAVEGFCRGIRGGRQ